MPKRAQYLRVIHLELNRIMSHLVWLGTSALDLGAISMFWYCFRERETILDLFEMSSGQRMHTRYIQVGGVMEDIPRRLRADACARSATIMPDRVDQYLDLLAKQRDRPAAPAQRRRRSARRTLLALGVTGPLLRAAGNPWDLRKAMPYSSYEDFDFKIPVGTVGDNYDRFFVRIAEMKESVKIIEQALDGLPEGPHITEDRKVALPPRHELATSMEALIHHFKLVTEGFRVPPGEVYYPIESPRGELGCFVRSDGSTKPARVHMRDPRFVNLQAHRADGQGPLHRRPDRDARDARPDPRRDRPVMAIDPTRVPRFAHGSRVPGWDEAADLTKDPAGVPDPATTPVPEELRARRSRRYMARYPDHRSAAIPALHAVQARYGWCSPQGDRAGGVRDAPDAGLPDARSPPSTTCSTRSRSAATTIYVCTNISCSLRGADELLAAFAGARRRGPELQRARASSASARATSRRWPPSTAATSGRSRPTRCPPSLEAVRRGEEPLPERQLKRLHRSPTRPTDREAVMSDHAPVQGHRRARPATRSRSTRAAAATRRCARR